MRALLLSILLPCAAALSAQGDSSLLRVRGSASVTVAPDVGELRIGVEAIAPRMHEATDALGRQSSSYDDYLAGLDFDLGDVHTTRFEVSRHRVYRDGERVDSGYVASQQITVEFSYSPSRLSTLLASLGDAPGDADLSFGFELSEALKDSVQHVIIERAFASAEARAQTLAAAAGVRLTRLVSVEYAGSEGYYGMQELDPVAAFTAGAPVMDEGTTGFRPADLVFRDSVELEYETSEQ